MDEFWQNTDSTCKPGLARPRINLEPRCWASGLLGLAGHSTRPTKQARGPPGGLALVAARRHKTARRFVGHQPTSWWPVRWCMQASKLRRGRSHLAHLRPRTRAIVECLHCKSSAYTVLDQKASMGSFHVGRKWKRCQGANQVHLLLHLLLHISAVWRK